MPSDKFRQRNPKNKQTKFQLVFDEDSRKDFLTGFQKRKKARKKIAHQEAEDKRKEERRQERQKRREAYEEELKNIRLPDVDSAAPKKKAVTYDHPEHTVTVTSVTSLDLKKEHGGIGDNEVEYEDDDISNEEDNVEEEEGEEEEDEDRNVGLNDNDDDDGEDNRDDSNDAIKQRLNGDAANKRGDGDDDKVKDAKSKKRAIMNKRREQIKKQASRRKKGVSQATVKKMKSMKRKSLGKFMKRGSGRKKGGR